MKRSIKVLSLAIATISVSQTLSASDAIGPGDREARWLIGGGAATATNIYAGEDSHSSIFPSVAFNGDRFFVKNGTLNYSVQEWNSFSLGLTAGYDANFLSFEEEYRDNQQLVGLVERDATIDGGFYINHTTDLGRLQFSYLTDLGNKHDGQTASIKYTFDLKAGDWYINPMIGANWVSDDKVDHYFGVSSAESTSTRLSYEGDSAVNLFAGVRARYEFSTKWDLNLETGITKFGSGITDSSIVDDDTAYYGALSVQYNF